MKTKKWIILLIVTSVLLAGCTNMDKSLLKASSFIEEGSFDKGIKIYKNLLEKNKDNPVIYMALSNAYKMMGDEAAEEGALKEALVYSNDKEEIYDLLVDFYEEKDEVDKFEKLYERYEDKIYSEKAILYKSQIYKNSGEYDLSFQELQKIDIDKAKDTEVLEALLPFYLNEENKDKLEKIVDKAISINDKGTVFQAYKYAYENGGLFVHSAKLVDLDDDGVLENIFVISDGDEFNTITFSKLVAQNAISGEIIDTLDLENYYVHFMLEFGNLTGDKKKDILLSAHVGGYGTPNAMFLYGFDNGKLKEKEFQLSSDMEYNFLDDFKIEIASREFDKVYSFEIGKEYRDEYVGYDYYTRNGKSKLLSHDVYGLEMVSVYHIEELNRDGIIYQLPSEGTYMTKDPLGLINIVYIYEAGWKPYSVEMVDYEGNEFKYKSYAEKSELPEAPKEDDTIKESKRILNMSKSEVVDNFGQANSIDYYQAEYYEYGDKLIYFNGNKVSAIWWHNPVDKFGISGKLTNQKIRETLGEADFDGQSESSDAEYVIYYEMEGLTLHFTDIDEYGGYVLVKYK